jgi:hypothetical protein
VEDCNEYLIDSMSHVELAIRVRRTIVKHKLGIRKMLFLPAVEG